MISYKSTYDQDQGSDEYIRGQELIWDYGRGYEIVQFIKKTKRYHGSWMMCRMLTGVCTGKKVILNNVELKEFPKLSTVQWNYFSSALSCLELAVGPGTVE